MSVSVSTIGMCGVIASAECDCDCHVLCDMCVCVRCYCCCKMFIVHCV